MRTNRTQKRIVLFLLFLEQEDKGEQERIRDHQDSEYAHELHEQRIPVGVHDQTLLHFPQVWMTVNSLTVNRQVLSCQPMFK